MSSIKRFATLGALLLSLIALGACNTVEGVGRDLQSGGRAIEDAAD